MKTTLYAGILVALSICAGLPAQFAFAAVPVEESVEETGSTADQQSDRRQPAQMRPRDRVRNLDIPATIEPGGASPTIPPTIEPNRAFQNADQNQPSQSQYAQPTQEVGGGQLSQLFYQLQILQQEVQTLRGQVEEQDYEIKRLQREQKEQYLDLDQRVVALVENRPAPGPVASRPSSPASTSDPGVGGSPQTLTEREAYKAAFDAMRNRQFDVSLNGFQQLIGDYPNGQFTPNAYYWIGELHLAANGDPELARQSFVQVVSLYPDHQKAPDALYKLGVVYQTLGDTETARRYLDEVQKQHPDSAAAGLAAKYAAEL
ncbi:MAG: tol-pal system protein YbgF [Pseudomonadota bacterium]